MIFQKFPNKPGIVVKVLVFLQQAKHHWCGFTLWYPPQVLKFLSSDPQAKHHWCGFTLWYPPQVLNSLSFDHKPNITAVGSRSDNKPQVLKSLSSDDKPNITDVGSRSDIYIPCLLTTSQTSLVWVHTLIPTSSVKVLVFWPQAKHHWCGSTLW